MDRAAGSSWNVHAVRFRLRGDVAFTGVLYS